LKVGDRSGAFLLDYGATASTLSVDVFGNGPDDAGTVVSRTISLPTFTAGTFGLAKDWISSAPAGGQLGIVGTDFLTLLTADFLFRDEGGDVRIGERPCRAADLPGHGMAAVSQRGFFSSDPSRVAAGRANVPVLYLRIGEVSVWAQIDTGYDDSARRTSIDINDALYQRLVRSGVVLEADRQLELSTCDGRESRSVYTLKNARVMITDEKGAAIADIGSPNLIRKARNGCGGIATLEEPAAQLGVSALTRLGRVVFDPKSELVWVPVDRAASRSR
jgi:hypothetical protein